MSSVLQQLALRVVAAVAFSWLFLCLFIPINLSAPQLFYIEKGASITHIASQLENQNIWQHSQIARWFLRGASCFGQIQAGEYQLRPGMSLSELATQWIQGRRYQRHLIFLPGQSWSQLTHTLHNAQGLTHSNHLSERSVNLLQGISNEALSITKIEGLLYPDTYAYEYGDSDISLIKRARRRWLQQYNSLWQNFGKDSPYQSLYQACIAASLIEKEGKTDKDKAMIAGVIANRLILKMPLQVDASVIYALGDQYRGHLKHSDMAIKSDYNTYLHRGLPPSPIALFTTEDLKAALRPIKHDYLYYVLSENGQHIFAKDYKTHRHNIHYH